MDYRLSTSLGFRMARLSRLHQMLACRVLQKLGIRSGAIGILVSLYEEEGISQDDLSAKLSIDKAATARALCHMEEDGLVTRSADPKNRRRNLVHLAPGGRAIREELCRELCSLRDIYTAGMSEEECEAVLNTFDRLISNIQQAIDSSEEFHE